MPTEYVIALVLLVALAALAALPPTRQFFARQYARLRSRLPQRQPPSTGATISVKAAGARPAQSGSSRPLLDSRQLMALVAVLLILLLVICQVPRLLTPVDQFVVLVAPFHDIGGSVGQTGRAVAGQLVDVLPQASRGRVVARLVDAPPADPNEALRVMETQGADALIWGEVTPGALLDQESLLPVLAYRPNGLSAPAAWAGYSGRFALPSSYRLSATPLNGQVVLPALLGALADYDAGEVDSTLAVLDGLARDYSALAPILPQALRGNILWARGEYEQAATAYRQAIGGAAEDQTNRQLALLFNNLGAILQDAGDSAGARQAFDQAVAVLYAQPPGEQDLGELRFNLGIESLRAGAPDQALASLQVARSLLPPTTPLLLTLSEAYRANGLFAEAQAMLDAAILQVSADVAMVPPQVQGPIGNGLRAATQQQRALLGLAQVLQADGPLLWELQAAGSLPTRSLNNIRSDLVQSVKETEALSRGWTRRSAAEDAARHTVAGRIAIEQSRRAETLLQERQRWQAAIDIQLWRAQGGQPPQGIAALWSQLTGDRSLLGQARERLGLLTARQDDLDATILLGHALLLAEQPTEAAKQFDDAAARAPQRPEPVYGQALVALPTDRARARQLLSDAIELDERYFPARQKLVEIAEQDQDWPAAVAQRRWLAENRPTTRNRLALAETLRHSGSSGRAEAERVLLALAEEPGLGNAGRVMALLELSRLYHDNSDPEGARVALQHAQRIAPRDPMVAYELAQLLAEQGQLDEAEAQFKLALAENPDYIEAHLGLGQLYTRRGEPAAEQYRAALDAGASDLGALKQIGKVLLSTDEYEAAISAYQRALREAPDDPELHHGLAQANLGLNRRDIAQQEEQKALELKQGNYPEALVGLGNIALGNGQPDQAVQHYQAAIVQNDGLTTAYLGLGRAAAAQGNWSVAQAHFQSALSRKLQLDRGAAAARQCPAPAGQR